MAKFQEKPEGEPAARYVNGLPERLRALVDRYLANVAGAGGVIDWARRYPRVHIRGDDKERNIVTLNTLPEKGWMIQGQPLEGIPLKPRRHAVMRVRQLKASAGGDTFALLMWERAELSEIETFLDIALDVLREVYVLRDWSA